MSILSNLRLSAVNRHRKRLFGDESLKVYTTTPGAGEAVAATFTTDWFGHRVDATTDAAGGEAGAWQFQTAAAATWETTETFMLKIVALTVGTRRWRVTKIENPIGVSLIWKIRAEIQ